MDLKKIELKYAKKLKKATSIFIKIEILELFLEEIGATEILKEL